MVAFRRTATIPRMRYVATALALFVVATAAAAEEWRGASSAEPDPIVLRPSEPPAETTATLLELKRRPALPAPDKSGPGTSGPKTTGLGANGGGTTPASPGQPTPAAQPSPGAPLTLTSPAPAKPTLGASPAPAPKPVAIRAADDDDHDDGGDDGDDDRDDDD
jgi:hypothetical protein